MEKQCKHPPRGKCNHPSKRCYNQGCRCPECEEFNANPSRAWRKKNSVTFTSSTAYSVEDEYDCTLTMESYKRAREAS